MNKKLLLTSALCGSAMLSGVALADTAITGNMTLTYMANSEAATANSNNGFGRETQINIANSGDLNNGLGYKAGFSLEFDGNSEGASTSNENVYIDIVSGDTTVSFGIDHLPNASQSAAPRVAEHANTSLAQLSTTAEIYKYHPGGGIKESFGIGLIQNNVAGGYLAASYVPKVGDTGGNDSDIDGASGNSAYNVTYKGNAGVDGLTLLALYQKEDKNTSATQDIKVLQYGASYNFGQFAAGVQINDTDESTLNTDTKSIEYGVTAALSDNFSAGVTYIETDRNTAGLVDEEITMASIGYNLGPVMVTASYTQLSNASGNASTADVEAFNLRVGTKF